MMKKRLPAALLAAAACFLLSACEAVPAKSDPGLVITVETAEGEIRVDTAAEKVSVREVSVTDTAGRSRRLRVRGFDLLPLLQEAGVELTGLSSCTLTAVDGYVWQAPAASLSGGLLLCPAPEADPPAVLCLIPDGPVGAVIAGLRRVGLNYAAPEAPAPPDLTGTAAGCYHPD